MGLGDRTSLLFHCPSEISPCRWSACSLCWFFFFQAEDGIRDLTVTGVQTCALPISLGVQETEQVAQPVGRGAVAQEPTLAPLRDQAGRLECVEVVRQRRGGDTELLLDQIGRASCRERV